MLLSFLVPVYNVKEYIKKCLDSILAQSGADFEVVLLDDGSTDGSGKICDEYARRYPEIIRVIHKKNDGLFLTRRRGFKEAKGDWLVCVDSDDFIMPNYLQTIVDAINKYDCDMVMFDYESFYPDGHTEASGIDMTDVQIYEGVGKKDIYKRRLLKNKYNNMWSKAIKKTVVDIETDYSVYGIRNMCEDAIQSYELYTRAKKIVFIPSVLYSYRRNIASITANISMDYWYALRIGYELGWKYLKKWDMSEDVTHAYAARCVSYYCDFLEWILTEVKIEKGKRKEIFDETILQNDAFDSAAMLYKKEYLATKYLKIRNPIIIRSIHVTKSFSIAKMVFRAEKILRKS